MLATSAAPDPSNALRLTERLYLGRRLISGRDHLAIGVTMADVREVARVSRRDDDPVLTTTGEGASLSLALPLL